MATIISEFSPGSDGRHYNGTCTQASASMALMMSNPKLNQSYQAGVNLMIAMRDSMFARGECGSNGSANIVNMTKELRLRGADIDLQINYTNGSIAYDWVGYLRARAGTYPIVLQLNNTRALAPVNSWNANVDCHAIAILGKQPNGYIVGDPNRPAGNTQSLIYSIQLLQKAQPCGMIGIKPKEVSKMLDLPSGWTQTGSESSDNLEWIGPASPIDGKQYSVSHGILYFLRSGNWRGGTPVSDIYLDPDGYYRQVWTDSVVQWKDGQGGSWFNVGVDWLRQKQQITNLQAQQPSPKAVQALAAIQSLKEALS